MRRDAAAAVEEVLGADARRDQSAAGGEGPQIQIETPLVRLLVFETCGLGGLEHLLKVLRERLPVILIP